MIKLLIILAVIVLIIDILIIISYLKDAHNTKNRKYEGILHIGKVNGHINYNFESFVPFDQIEKLKYMVMKIETVESANGKLKLTSSKNKKGDKQC